MALHLLQHRLRQRHHGALPQRRPATRQVARHWRISGHVTTVLLSDWSVSQAEEADGAAGGLGDGAAGGAAGPVLLRRHAAHREDCGLQHVGQVRGHHRPVLCLLRS